MSGNASTRGASGVRVFNDAAARDSQMPTPTIGQVVMLIDTGALLVWYGARLGWCPPWNLPWGEVGYAVLTSNSPALPAYDGQPLDNLKLSVPLLPGRQYECVFEGLVTSTTNDEIIVVTVHCLNGSATLTDLGTPYKTNVFSQAFSVSMSGEAGDAARWSAKFTWQPSGSDVPFFYVTAANLNQLGTANLVANQNGTTRLRISDLGPAGNPTYS